VPSSDPSPLSRLFFDIDDTLYSTSEFARTARWNSVEALVDVGVEMDPEPLFAELQEVIREFSSNYPYHYDKLLLRVPDDALENVDNNIAIAAAVIAYHRTKHEQLEPFPDVLPFLNELNDSPVPNRPGVISEGLSVKQAEKLLRLNVYRHFDPHGIYISEQVGISKPNPKLFQTALRESDTNASEAMMIGDRPRKDMTPANDVGMITVFMDRVSVKQRSRDERAAFPDYTVQTYRELAEILNDDFGLNLTL